MHAPARSAADADTAHLRTTQQVLAGAAFLAAVAVVSLPGLAAWTGAWLLLAPLAALATASLLAWMRRAPSPARRSVAARRPRPAAAATRRATPRRTARRALAAIVLR